MNVSAAGGTATFRADELIMCSANVFLGIKQQSVDLYQKGEHPVFWKQTSSASSSELPGCRHNKQLNGSGFST